MISFHRRKLPAARRITSGCWRKLRAAVRRAPGFAEQMFRGIHARRSIPSQMLTCVFSPKPSSSATLPSLHACRASRWNPPELLVEDLDFLQTYARDLSISARPPGWTPQLVANTRACRLHQFLDLLRDAFPDAFDFATRSSATILASGSSGFRPPGRHSIGSGFEQVLALEFQQRADRPGFARRGLCPCAK